MHANLSGCTDCSGLLTYYSENPEKYVSKQLPRVIQYMRSTQDITLIMEADDNPQWWVERSYSVHLLISTGKGFMYTASSKQKLNT